jgi:equilibrative nucleoside transporter 1/2/3
MLMVAIGIGYIFPFSALSNPVDYWNLIFPNFNVLFLISNVYMVINLVCVTFLVFFGGKPNFTLRMVVGFIGQFLILVFVPSSYFFHLSTTMNLYVIIICTAVIAAFTSLIDSCAIAFASQYPAVIQESLQLGIGVSTLVGSIYRIGTKLAFPLSQVVLSSLIYFYSGALTVLVCVFAYFNLLHLPYSQHYLAAKRSSVDGAARENTTLLRGQSPPGYMISDTKESEQCSTAVFGLVESTRSRLSVLRRVWWRQLQVLLVFATTLALWPSLLTELPCRSWPALQHSEWWALLLLALYSLCDVAGRCLVPYRGLSSTHTGWAVLLRLLYVPLTLRLASPRVTAPLADLCSLLLSGSLGLSNGYFGSLCIVSVSESVCVQERAAAGQLAGFCLILGTVVGSSAALLLQKLIHRV